MEVVVSVRCWGEVLPLSAHLFREEIGGNNSYYLRSMNPYNPCYIGHSFNQSLLETISPRNKD
jgi:hypothetical protein